MKHNLPLSEEFCAVRFWGGKWSRDAIGTPCDVLCLSWCTVGHQAEVQLGSRLALSLSRCKKRRGMVLDWNTQDSALWTGQKQEDDKQANTGGYAVQARPGHVNWLEGFYRLQKCSAARFGNEFRQSQIYVGIFSCEGDILSLEALVPTESKPF